jgi:hypothetical protein
MNKHTHADGMHKDSTYVVPEVNKIRKDVIKVNTFNKQIYKYITYRIELF